MNRYHINATLEARQIDEIPWEWEEDFPWLYAKQDKATIQWRNDHLCAEFLTFEQKEDLHQQLTNLGALNITIGTYTEEEIKEHPYNQQ
jgi:hypothetical protein